MNYFLIAVDLLNMNNAIDALDQHQLRGENDRVIDVSDVLNCLMTMFEGIAEDHHDLVNVPLCVDLVLNWILNVYDRLVYLHFLWTEVH